ncbi:hypothetical protein MXB_5519 [Myxobolus squamalis]|nr:hypothetical protein MXB_5519 [Myxobolus squamalis]
MAGTDSFSQACIGHDSKSNFPFDLKTRSPKRRFNFNNNIGTTELHPTINDIDKMFFFYNLLNLSKKEIKTSQIKLLEALLKSKFEQKVRNFSQSVKQKKSAYPARTPQPKFFPSDADHIIGAFLKKPNTTDIQKNIYAQVTVKDLRTLFGNSWLNDELTIPAIFNEMLAYAE